MTSFIKTEIGALIAISEIIEIGKLNRKTSFVKTSDGKLHAVHKRLSDLKIKIELETAPSEKAEPGYSIVLFFGKRENHEIRDRRMGEDRIKQGR